MHLIDIIKPKVDNVTMHVLYNPNEKMLSREEYLEGLEEKKDDFNLKDLFLKMNPDTKVKSLTLQSVAFYEEIDWELVSKVKAKVSYPIEFCKIKISNQYGKVNENAHTVSIKELSYKKLNGDQFLSYALFHSLMHNDIRHLTLDVYYYESDQYYPGEILNDFGFYAIDLWAYSIHSEIASKNPQTTIWQVGQQDFAMCYDDRNIPGFYLNFINRDYYINKARVDLFVEKFPGR